MPFTMSYGAPLPIKEPAKAAPKKLAPKRRKVGTPPSQAPSALDPALAQTVEAAAPATAMELPADDGELLARADRDAAGPHPG